MELKVRNEYQMEINLSRTCRKVSNGLGINAAYLRNRHRCGHLDGDRHAYCKPISDRLEHVCTHTHTYTHSHYVVLYVPPYTRVEFRPSPGASGL